MDKYRLKRGKPVSQSSRSRISASPPGLLEITWVIYPLETEDITRKRFPKNRYETFQNIGIDIRVHIHVIRKWIEIISALKG